MATRQKPFTQQDPTKGNFAVYKNLAAPRDPQDNLPAFTGQVILPGTTEKRGVSLWASRSKKTGHLVLGGPVTPDRTTQWANLAPINGTTPDQTKYVTMKGGEEPFPVKPNHVVLFTSPNKDAITEGKKAPPAFFGYYNPGGDAPVMVVSAFEHVDRNNNIMLEGPMEAYDPEKSFDQQMAKDHGQDMAGNDMGEGGPEIPPHLLSKKSSRRERSSEGPSR